MFVASTQEKRHCACMVQGKSIADLASAGLTYSLHACTHLAKNLVLTAGEVCGAVAEVGSQTPASKIMMACIQSTWSKCTLEFWLLHQHKV
jgi:hypothetical protein